MVAWGEPLEPAVSAVWIVISAGVSLVALVVVLALCTCQDKPKEEKTDTKQEVLKRKSKSNNSEAKAEPQIALTDVKIEEDEENRQSNGAVQAADQTSNGRPRSGDRALPEIPPFRGAAQKETEEEDNDPNYDVIVKASRGSAQRPVSKTAKSTALPAKHHAYEKVSERNPYEKVKDQNPYEMVSEKEGAASAAVPENEYAGPRSEGSDYYAEVKGDTGAEYSQINTSKRNSVKMSMTPTTPTANTKEEDDYVQRPPVPRKNFEQNQAAANGDMMPPIPGPSQPQRSPDLPPRNMPLSDLTSPVAGAMMSANVQAGATAGAVSTAVDAGRQPTPPAQPAGKGPTGKSEPSYSKVTARESLAHMRERQAQSGQRDDTMYDYIKYEGAEGAPSNQLAPVQEGNRGSMTSDLYAEISTAGGGSQRNSMYARIGEAKAAPVPPSVDILKQLDQMDDGAEPGYSLVGAKGSATPAVSKTPNGDKATDPYSKVDHSKKRQTIHIDSNIENKVGATATELDEMYAKVTKVKTTNAELAASNNGASAVGGARIKIVEGEGSATGSIEPGYARIRDGAVDANGYQTVEINRRSTGVTVSIDPGYQTVDIGNMRNSGSEFDPNYEMVTTQENGIMVGVQPPNPNWQPLKRDPVYQEIPEVKQGSQNSPKK